MGRYREFSSGVRSVQDLALLQLRSVRDLASWYSASPGCCDGAGEKWGRGGLYTAATSLAPFLARPRPSFAPEEEDDDDNDDDDDDDDDSDDDDDGDDDNDGEEGGAPINSRRCFSNSSDVNMPRRNASSRRDRAPNGSLPIRRCRRCCRPW